MIAIEEVAELIVKMNDTSRELVARLKVAEDENFKLKEQLKKKVSKAVPANG